MNEGHVTGRPRTKLLFVVTEDWYFWSHRLPMARAAMDAGFEVAVAARVTAHRERIEALGIRVLPLRLDRRSANPLAESRAVTELFRLYRRERPDIVHHVAMKPVLYGSLAARMAGVGAVVNAMAGMGFVFTAESLNARLLKPTITAAFGFLLNRPGSRLLVQNEDDATLFRDAGIVAADRISIIPGSGVDTDAFTPRPEPPPPVTALCVARLLRDKGIGELVEAARLLHRDGVPIRIRIAGDPDPANPASIPAATLERWRNEGIVDFLGRRTDIADLYAGSHIAVLPSYREGMPKSLLEGAASGLPLVTTDVPGCRALVRHEENGLLVPARDARALADALKRLALDADLRRRLGSQARRDAETIYSEAAIGRAVVALYDELVR